MAWTAPPDPTVATFRLRHLARMAASEAAIDESYHLLAEADRLLFLYRERARPMVFADMAMGRSTIA